TTATVFGYSPRWAPTPREGHQPPTTRHSGSATANVTSSAASTTANVTSGPKLPTAAVAEAGGCWGRAAARSAASPSGIGGGGAPKGVRYRPDMSSASSGGAPSTVTEGSVVVDVGGKVGATITRGRE